MRHRNEDELILHYYGEGRRRAAVEHHLEECPDCAARYRGLAATLRMVGSPDVPERGDQYGLEVWQRIRHQLPARSPGWWRIGSTADRTMLAAAVAILVMAAFAAGRVWPDRGVVPETTTSVPAITDHAQRQRILLTSVADHLDRSDRVLTDIMNAPTTNGSGDISSEQRWAEDLLTASRLYRQDAVDTGERSVASVLDELERSLLEIVHRPSKVTAADLDDMRRRIDAAALLFKVRIMSDELRRHETPAPLPHTT